MKDLDNINKFQKNLIQILKLKEDKLPSFYTSENKLKNIGENQMISFIFGVVSFLCWFLLLLIGAFIFSFLTFLIFVLSLARSQYLMNKEEFINNSNIFISIMSSVNQLEKNIKENKNYDKTFLNFINFFNNTYENKQNLNTLNLNPNEIAEVFKFIPNKDKTILNQINLNKINLFRGFIKEYEYDEKSFNTFKLFKGENKELFENCVKYHEDDEVEFFMLNYLSYKFLNNESLGKEIKSEKNQEVLTEEQKDLIKIGFKEKKKNIKVEKELNKIYI